MLKKRNRQNEDVDMDDMQLKAEEIEINDEYE